MKDGRRRKIRFMSGRAAITCFLVFQTMTKALPSFYNSLFRERRHLNRFAIHTTYINSSPPPFQMYSHISQLMQKNISEHLPIQWSRLIRLPGLFMEE